MCGVLALCVGESAGFEGVAVLELERGEVGVDGPAGGTEGLCEIWRCKKLFVSEL